MAISLTHNCFHAPEVMAQFVPAAARRVLECRLGDGMRAAAIKAKGAAELVALSETAPESSAADEVLVGPLQDLELPFPERYFDCIVCDDTLARLRDPAPVLERLAPLLADGGLLVATAPNLQHIDHVEMLAQGRWEAADQGALAREHIRFFTGYELVQLLRRCGFETKRLSALVSDDAARMPLDDAGCYRHCRVVVGPVTPDEHRAFLVREYLALAVKAS